MEYNSTICCKFHAKLTDAIRQKSRFEVKSCSGTAKILLVCRAEDLGFGIFPAVRGGSEEEEEDGIFQDTTLQSQGTNPAWTLGDRDCHKSWEKRD